MSEIMSLISFLQVTVLIGGIARIVYCLIAMSVNAENEKSYRTRIHNALVFVVISEGVLELSILIRSYFVF